MFAIFTNSSKNLENKRFIAMCGIGELRCMCEYIITENFEWQGEISAVNFLKKILFVT